MKTDYPAMNRRQVYEDGSVEYIFIRGIYGVAVVASPTEMRLHRYAVAWRIMNARNWLRQRVKNAKEGE